jgi:hypothetical protein
MTNYLYHPGDRVYVRPDLTDTEEYKMLSGKSEGESWGIYSWMKDYAGKEIVIQKIELARGVYTAQGINGCIWSDEMFEPLNECFCSSLL